MKEQPKVPGKTGVDHCGFCGWIGWIYFNACCPDCAELILE